MVAVVVVAAVAAHLFYGSAPATHGSVHTADAVAAAPHVGSPPAHHTDGPAHQEGAAGEAPDDGRHHHLFTSLCSAVLAAALIVGTALHRRSSPGLLQKIVPAATGGRAGDDGAIGRRLSPVDAGVVLVI